MSTVPPAGKRGRPFKPTESVPMVNIGQASIDELPNLIADLRTISQVAALPAVKQRQLGVLILEALAGYRSASGVRGVWHPVVDVNGDVAGQAQMASSGRPPKLESAPFLEDCVAAWEAVTGERVEVWFSDATGMPSVTMEIADAALAGRGGWVGVSGLKKRARKASQVRRKKAGSQA